MNKQLDELQLQTEKLLSLIKEREIGCMTWWDVLYFQMDEVKRAIYTINEEY